MPRRKIGKRSKTWELKTKPELLHPILEARHEAMVFEIKKHYFSIDELYERVTQILDERGIHTQERLLYRSYAEELYKLAQKYSSKALGNSAEAVAIKYLMYGLEREILKKISSMFNLEAPRFKPWRKHPALIQIPMGSIQGNVRLPRPAKAPVLSGGSIQGNVRLPRPAKAPVLSGGSITVSLEVI